MDHRLLNLILVFFIAVVVALNGKSLVANKDLGTALHLAANSSEANDHHHNSDSGQTQHSHRHSPKEPKHEHTLPNDEILSVDSFSVPSPNQIVTAIFTHFPDQKPFTETASIELSQLISSLFRPPIFPS